ncbi:MAG: hypothetical protein ACI4LX_11115 [Treponema sp.]
MLWGFAELQGAVFFVFDGIFHKKKNDIYEHKNAGIIEQKKTDFLEELKENL